jgi:cytochrome d ubiquinol oxidase subunit I
MFGLDAFHLARIQFAFTVSFHIIFPAITMAWPAIWRYSKVVAENKKSCLALALPLLVEDFRRQLRHGRRLRSGDGLPVRHQLERFLQFAGSITGPLLTYEVLTAFFLEAGSSG